MTCPRCGSGMQGVGTAGPGEHRAIPCGCRISTETIDDGSSVTGVTESRRLIADGGRSTAEVERWWGQPLDARRFHVFEGKGKMSQTLCNGGWLLSYDGQDPDVDPENDTFKEGRDCKECSRKAGVLEDEQ